MTCRCALPHAGGSGGCPDFARGFSAELKKNRTVVSAIAGLCVTTSASLTASIVLAPLAPPVAAVAVVLFLLLDDCQADQALRTAAREAVAGCDILITVLAVFGLAALGPAIIAAGLGLTAEAGVAALVAAFTALRIALNVLAGGNAPTTGMVVAVVGPMVAVAGLPPTLVASILEFGVSQSEKLPSSPARRKAGTNNMNSTQIEQDLLRRIVRASNPKTVWKDAPAVVGGDFRPLVMATARFRASVRQQAQGKSTVVGNTAGNIEAVRYLAALLKTPSARWTQAQALAAIANPAAAPSTSPTTPTTPTTPATTSSAGPLVAAAVALVAVKVLF